MNNSLTEFSPNVNPPTNLYRSVKPVVTPSVTPSCIPVYDLSLGSIAEKPSHAENSLNFDDYDKSKDSRFRNLRKAAELLPGEKVSKCCRHLRPGFKQWTARYNPDRESSGLGNLQRCGDPFCPNCGLWLSFKKLRELTVYFAEVEKRGDFNIFCSFTAQHHKGDDPELVQDAINKAVSQTFSGRWFQDLKQEYGINGGRYDAECTVGGNGFHPHRHGVLNMVMELTGPALDKFADKVKVRYIAKLAKLGFAASYEHGVDVRVGDAALAHYLAKFGRDPKKPVWGLEAELALSDLKRGRINSLTHPELLSAACGDSEPLSVLMQFEGLTDPEAAKIRAGQLFVQMRRLMKNHHLGRYMKGTKEYYGVDQAQADYEAANPLKSENTVEVLVGEGVAVGRLHGMSTGTPDLRGEVCAIVRQSCQQGDLPKLLSWLEQHKELRLTLTDVGRDYINNRALELWQQERLDEKLRSDSSMIVDHPVNEFRAGHSSYFVTVQHDDTSDLPLISSSLVGVERYENV